MRRSPTWPACFRKPAPSVRRTSSPGGSRRSKMRRAVSGRGCALDGTGRGPARTASAAADQPAAGMVPAGPLPPWDAEGNGCPIDTVFLWGAPGSCVEQVATVVGHRRLPCGPPVAEGGWMVSSGSAASTRLWQTSILPNYPRLARGPSAHPRRPRDRMAGVVGQRVLRVLRPQLQHAEYRGAARSARHVPAMAGPWSPTQVAIPSLLPQAAAWPRR